MMGEEKKEGEEGVEEEGEWCCVKQTNQTNACQPHIPTIILHICLALHDHKTLQGLARRREG